MVTHFNNILTAYGFGLVQISLERESVCCGGFCRPQKPEEPAKPKTDDKVVKSILAEIKAKIVDIYKVKYEDDPYNNAEKNADPEKCDWMPSCCEIYSIFSGQLGAMRKSLTPSCCDSARYSGGVSTESSGSDVSDQTQPLLPDPKAEPKLLSPKDGGSPSPSGGDSSSPREPLLATRESPRRSPSMDESICLSVNEDGERMMPVLDYYG